MLPIDFYFDFSSPYGYIASHLIDALGAKYGRVDGEPFWGADRLPMIDEWLRRGAW